MQFAEKVYFYTKKIPRGRVSSYKEIGRKLRTKAYRAIGQALKANLNAQIPCHRVVKSGGLLGGYQGKNVKKKIKLLRKEGVLVEKGKIKDFKNKIFKF